MSKVELIRAESYRAVPWKNGGGMTREIAAADGWRLSIATIERDGPFSDFTGYDRTIVAIEGNGIELRIDGEIAVLDRLYVPFRFRGEARTECRLIDGPVRDFNVMTQREHWGHEVTVHELASEAAHVEVGPIAFVHVLRGRWAVDAGDTMRVNQTERLALEPVKGAATLCVVSLRPASAT